MSLSHLFVVVLGAVLAAGAVAWVAEFELRPVLLVVLLGLEQTLEHDSVIVSSALAPLCVCSTAARSDAATAREKAAHTRLNGHGRAALVDLGR